MKNTVLWAALFTLIGTQSHADVQIQQPKTSVQENLQNPATTQSQPLTQPASQTVTTTAQQAPVINCEYKIPAQTKTIDQSLVLNWSEKATIQAFDFNPATIDAQLVQLQHCFTEQGWTSFNSALEKSGNLDAIKSQNLHVSSVLDGQIQVKDVKDNQWKIMLPIQVVYQNDKEKVTQLLDVDVTIGRKITGDLGINQMIATPRPAVTPQPTPAPTDTTTPAATVAPTTAVEQQPTTSTP